MSYLASGGASKTYLNPVYRKSFPDPFVIKHDGEYFGYSTGFADDGNIFGVITSSDLVNWTELGGAMKPLEPSPPFYWAPEVTFTNGKFYLYYSVGNETLMEIRVAVSERPDGGFVDSGHRLTYEDFAIDAHVFIDDDGSKYLFYASDFLQHSHIGTGTVVDRMIDWCTLAGEPRPVTRAKYDWQVYDPHRIEKGGVRWHTVEGPTILKRKGTYYEMFSGGNWQNTTYGVSFALSDSIDENEEWRQFSDGDKALPILRTEPGLIIGPGHNSVVRGPNNRELYCIYHRWTDTERVLAIDRMDFAGKRIFVVGATHTEQPAPFSAGRLDLSNVSTDDGWTFGDRKAVSDKTGHAKIQLNDLPSSFLCEITFRCGEETGENAHVGFRFGTEVKGMDLVLDPKANEARMSEGTTCKLHRDFDWKAKHLIRIEIDHRKLKIHLDDAALPTQVHRLPESIDSISLFSQNVAFEVSTFEFTEGFEELFEDDLPIESNGWKVKGGADHRIDAGELLVDANAVFEIGKHRPLHSSEFAANFRVVRHNGAGEFGLVLRSEEKDVVRFTMDVATSTVMLNRESGLKTATQTSLNEHHQLRVIKSGTEALCYVDDLLIKKTDVEEIPITAFVSCEGVSVAIEMIRLTSI